MDTKITSQRIQQAITKSGKTLVELEQISGVPHAAIQRYATGKTAKIPIDRLKSIAAATRVSPAWLMGWSDDPDDKVPFALDTAKPITLTQEEAAIVRQWRLLTNEQQLLIVRMLQAFQAERGAAQ